MCGRFTQTAAFDVLAERFGITVEADAHEELTARYNVAPSQDVPIIAASEKGRRLVTAKWGFCPAWAQDSKLAPINARAETVATSRLFSPAVRDGRCLIPATGFYESYLARNGNSRTSSGSRAALRSLSLDSGPRRTLPRQPVRSSRPMRTSYLPRFIPGCR